MKSITHIISALLVFSFSAYADSSFTCGAHGVKYEFQITDQRLSACPKWDVAKTPNPPCSAAQALSLSEVYFQRISDSASHKDHKWWFESIALVKLGEDWAWKATYEFWPRSGERRGRASSLQYWVLMDGKPVVPNVSAYKE
jgi:hypothetical protein